jgi:hypothetical protein
VIDLETALVDFLSGRCGKPLPHPDAVRDLYLRLVLERFSGNLTKSSRATGLHRRTIQRTLWKNRDRRHGDAEPCSGCVFCTVRTAPEEAWNGVKD